MEPISIDDFKKVEIRVGEIVSAETIEKSDKLLNLRVRFGPAGEDGKIEESPILSDISAFCPKPGALVGKRVLFVTNLAPRMMMGL